MPSSEDPHGGKKPESQLPAEADLGHKESDEIESHQPSPEFLQAIRQEIDLAVKTELSERLEKLVVRSVRVAVQESYEGPLPSPDDFGKYGDTLPDAPNRILKMAEKEQDYRVMDDRWLNRSAAILPFLGVICAFLIGIYSIWIGAELVKSGNQVIGTIFTGVGLGSLVASFIYGTRQTKKQKPEKHN